MENATKPESTETHNFLKNSLNFPGHHEDFDTKYKEAKCNYWFIDIFHVCSFYQLVRVGGIKYSES